MSDGLGDLDRGCHAAAGSFSDFDDKGRPLELWRQELADRRRGDRRTARVFVVTSFKVPHTGGASTHIEMLVSVLKERSLFDGILGASGLLGSVSTRIGSLPMRLFDKDRARASTLESTVRAYSRALMKQVSWGPGLVIHSHDPVATCAVLRCKEPGCVVVQTVHGPFSREFEMAGNDANGAFVRGLRALEREAFDHADLLLPVDHEQARILMETFCVEERRIRVIENAVELEGLSEIRKRAINGVAPQQPFFLVPRRLVAKNGVEFAIKALARLELGNVHLMIAGDGPLRRPLKKRSRRVGSIDRIHFLGALTRERLLDLYRTAAAVIVPSVPAFGVVEATSFVALEAMAIGVPVIASDIGGLHEIIVDDSHGLLVPPGDDAALAAAMRRTLEMDPGARANLISSAQARVRAAFDVGLWTSKVLGAYRDASGGL
jgi:glycosyltransferase involved in cell wall biosynthesis